MNNAATQFEMTNPNTFRAETLCLTESGWEYGALGQVSVVDSVTAEWILEAKRTQGWEVESR